MVEIDTKNQQKYSRRDLFIETKNLALGLVAGAVIDLIKPLNVFSQEQDNLFQESQESQIIPSGVVKEFKHLKLEENGPIIIQVCQRFDIDPHILLAILIMESPDEICTSESGAEGAYQIKPETREDLINKITPQSRLDIIRKSQGIEETDLRNPDIFKGQVFLACIYLEDERVKIPKGEISPGSSQYSENLQAIRGAAIKYHDGQNQNIQNPSEYGAIAGKRVVGIIELLKGSKSLEEVKKDKEVAVILGDEDIWRREQSAGFRNPQKPL